MSALVGLCAVWLSSALAASTPAAIPSSCADGGPKARAHEIGRRQGNSMVDSAWASVQHDCRERARVERSVRDALARRVLPDRASEALRCRDTGFRTGAEDGLVRIAAACPGS
jgi:hypothetical protein